MTAPLDREDQLREEHSTRLRRLHDEALRRQQTETEHIIRLAQNKRRYERAEDLTTTHEELAEYHSGCEGALKNMSSLEMIFDFIDEIPKMMKKR
jgi:hypothetical protein